MNLYVKQEKAAALIKRGLQRNERQEREREIGIEKRRQFTLVTCAYIHVLSRVYMYLHSVHTEQERAAVLVKGRPAHRYEREKEKIKGDIYVGT